MRGTLFKGTTWNTELWTEAHPEFNPHSGNNWNIAHVRNVLAEHGSLPPDRVEQSIKLLDGLLSTAISDQNSLRATREAIRAIRRVHAAVGKALADNDILRVKALIIDWEKEYGK